MNELNPYASPTTPNSAGLVTGIRHRLTTAALLGFVTALVGPAFLIGYYQFLGIGLGFVDSIQFFGFAYLAPATIFLTAGVAVGCLLSAILPSLSERMSCIISSVVAGLVLLLGIVLLLAHSLNFGVGPSGFEFPAFAVVCGFATTLATSIYLALA